uniref:Uncharacterized protein n=1 Tax=Cryptomonas curvata TaxID=233186 RepID=A0A7S0N144_9CRYP|mmetsp:Transcript_57583/g.120413  ORF Transcript_57583/g.120413 Transcript_57583/m.120413 type:complete len:159 (+) Transcript_57583:22-498(+)
MKPRPKRASRFPPINSIFAVFCFLAVLLYVVPMRTYTLLTRESVDSDQDMPPAVAALSPEQRIAVRKEMEFLKNQSAEFLEQQIALGDTAYRRLHRQKPETKITPEHSVPVIIMPQPPPAPYAAPYVSPDSHAVKERASAYMPLTIGASNRRYVNPTL